MRMPKICSIVYAKDKNINNNNGHTVNVNVFDESTHNNTVILNVCGWTKNQVK